MPIDTRTKILATIGPSTATKAKLAELIDSGADAFRINFSHGTYDEHKNRIKAIRKLEKEKKRVIAILADMQGPKLRVGNFKEEKIWLEEGQTFTLDMKNELGDKSRVCLPHKEIFAAIKVGDKLLVNDGYIVLEVVKSSKVSIETIVKVGGYISSHKGVNLPNTKLKISAITEKDKKITAYHEAGHAILAHLLPTQDPVQQISIIPSGNALGYTLNPPTEDKYSVYKNELKEKIAMLLGGRAAEEIIFGDVSGGASNDIERATKIAKNMVTKLGMSDLLGLRAFGNDHGEVFLGRDFSSSQDYSDDTAAKIDAEIHDIIASAYENAKRILTENIEKLHFVAEFLMRNEIMDGEQFAAAMNGDPSFEELEEMTEAKKRKSREENDRRRAELIAEERKRKEEEEQARKRAEEKAANVNHDSYDRGDDKDRYDRSEKDDKRDDDKHDGGDDSDRNIPF